MTEIMVLVTSSIFAFIVGLKLGKKNNAKNNSNHKKTSNGKTDQEKRIEKLELDLKSLRRINKRISEERKTYKDRLSKIKSQVSKVGIDSKAKSSHIVQQSETDDIILAAAVVAIANGDSLSNGSTSFSSVDSGSMSCSSSCTGSE